VSDIETRVRDAITMNVDLMDGPSRIIERALASVDHVRRSRRRRRALVSVVVVTAGVGLIARIAAADRDHGSGITVTAGSSTSAARAPKPIPSGGAPRWSVGVTRAQALALGRGDAIDPRTEVVRAKLASWAEIQAGGAATGSSPSDEPDRRVWAVSISGAPRPGQCCLAPHQPFRWGVVFIDATTKQPFAFDVGSTGDIAPWFARLPDHGG
jgi:hypothetical protein